MGMAYSIDDSGRHKFRGFFVADRPGQRDLPLGDLVEGESVARSVCRYSYICDSMAFA